MSLGQYYLSGTSNKRQTRCLHANCDRKAWDRIRGNGEKILKGDDDFDFFPSFPNAILDLHPLFYISSSSVIQST